MHRCYYSSFGLFYTDSNCRQQVVSNDKHIVYIETELATAIELIHCFPLPAHILPPRVYISQCATVLYFTNQCNSHMNESTIMFILTALH